MRQASAAGWQAIASLPEPNGGFVAGALNGELIAAGGTHWKDDTKHWLDKLWIYSPRQNIWRPAGTLSQPVAYAAVGSAGDQVWFVGGSTGTRTLSSLKRLKQGGVLSDMSGSRVGTVYSAGAFDGSKLYVIGGAMDQGLLNTATNACHNWDVKTGVRTELPALPVSSFVTGTAAACGGRVFVFGGARWDAGAETVANLDDVFSLKPGSKQWERQQKYPFAVRGVTAVALDQRFIYVAGGYKNDAEEFTSEAFLFDTRDNSFKPSAYLPYRAMVALVVLQGDLYCLGGEDRKKHRTDAAFRIPVRELLPSE